MKKLTFPSGHKFEIYGKGISIKVNGQAPVKEEIVLTEQKRKDTINEKGHKHNDV